MVVTVRVILPCTPAKGGKKGVENVRRRRTRTRGARASDLLQTPLDMLLPLKSGPLFPSHLLALQGGGRQCGNSDGEKTITYKPIGGAVFGLLPVALCWRHVQSGLHNIQCADVRHLLGPCFKDVEVVRCGVQR